MLPMLEEHQEGQSGCTRVSMGECQEIGSGGQSNTTWGEGAGVTE